MFCDGCGGAVQPGQAFCSKCGKQIVGPVSVMQHRPGRVQEHVRLLGILWLALSAFNDDRRHDAVRPGQHSVGSPATRGNGEWTPRVPDSAVEHGGDSVAGQGRVRVHCGMGIVAARALGARCGSGRWPLFLCSPTFHSERRSASTPCGSCCPRNRSRSTKRWRSRERRRLDEARSSEK